MNSFIIRLYDYSNSITLHCVLLTQLESRKSFEELPPDK